MHSIRVQNPIDHFFSGLGELEMRRTKLGIGWAKAEYEEMDVLSIDRLIGFTEFLLRGDWFQYMRSKDKDIPYHWLEFGHVFPQSGSFIDYRNFIAMSRLLFR